MKIVTRLFVKVKAFLVLHPIWKYCAAKGLHWDCKIENRKGELGESRGKGMRSRLLAAGALWPKHLNRKSAVEDIYDRKKKLWFQSLEDDLSCWKSGSLFYYTI